MKKREFLFSVFILIVLISPLVLAQTNLSVNPSDSNDVKIDKAYECLEGKVEDRGCSALSLEEKIFSLLSVNDCKEELLSDGKNRECWPESSCNIKQTAQAVLALDRSSVEANSAEEWLLSQNTTPDNVVWFLEIESLEETTCDISYRGGSHTINIGTDKKIDSSAGSCLTRSEDGYWLRVLKSCYGEEFETSCDQSFLTTLLFKKTDSSTIHVSDNTHSASPEGTTKEVVNSNCFSKGSGDCDYEGSLWAALALNKVDRDVSSFLPYLITMSEDNSELLPESFLAILTGYPDFENNLLLKQKQDRFWDESGDKFHDTALALLPFQSQTRTEKTNSKSWLLEIQEKDGCWNSGNIRNNGFILYSIFPRVVNRGGGGSSISSDCEDEGNYCMSGVDCQGTILSDQDCPGINRCCDTPPATVSCFEDFGGEICNSNQNCLGGTTPVSDDTSYGETCCVGGSCETPVEITECQENGGVCRSFDCNSDEDSSSYGCETPSQTCCIESSKSDGGYWWIWVLVILIILVVLAIIFRDRLRPYYFRVKSKFGRKRGGSPPSGRWPPGLPPGQRVATPSRRILSPSLQRRPTERRPPMIKKHEGELGDVLKKLKDMGK